MCICEEGYSLNVEESFNSVSKAIEKKIKYEKKIK